MSFKFRPYYHCDMSPPVLAMAVWDENNLFYSRKSSPNSRFTSTIQLSWLVRACIRACVFQM